MKPAPFAYHRARDLADAAKRMAAGPGRFVKALAGGQSLGPMLNLRVARPDMLVDISALADLRAVTVDGDRVRIGAGVTHAMIEDGAVPGRLGAILADVAGAIAYRAVRNRGTLGGSLAHADPAADWPAALLALGGELEIHSAGHGAGHDADGSRRLAIDDFFTGIFETALGDDEILVAVTLTRPGDDARWGYAKLCRKPGEFAMAIAAVLVDPARDIRRLVIGATDDRPILVADAGPLMAAKFADAELDALMPDFDPPRRALHRVAVRRAARMAGL